jgi:N-acetylated-alpha-linked acidic dipeptidase
VPIDALGSGSDYTAFLDFLQIASLDLGFSGDSSGGVYHSVYDSYHWFTHFSDGDFTHTAALSRVIGTALLRLADADVLPFEFKATAATLRGYADEIAGLPDAATRVDLSSVRESLAKLASAADDYEKTLGRLNRMSADEMRRARPQLGALNATLYKTERAFRHEAGLPRREWFKHLVYAPGLYTGYGVKTLPGIREGIEQSHWDEAQSFVTPVAEAIKKLTSEVNRAASALRRITDH